MRPSQVDESSSCAASLLPSFPRMPSMDPSLLPPDDGTEPDMECDPTLASCCQREIRDRRTQQAKLDAIRSVMPASVLPPTAWHVVRGLPLT